MFLIPLPAANRALGYGIWSFVNPSDKILLMCEVQKHRGPDKTSYFINSGVGLGSDRLGITNLKTGGRPVHNVASSISTVFNAEIYNNVELRLTSKL